MRQTLSRGVCAAAAATGILSLYGGTALADTSATGAAEGSPGMLSGNTVQVPAEVPVNVCGNTVGVLAALNGAFGNSCVNAADEEDEDEEEQPPLPSPGGCTDDCEPAPPVAPAPQPPRTTPPPTRTDRTPPPTTVEQPGKPPQLAETGGKALLAASAAGAALITGGTMLYRRGRAASHR
ncbi:chaplin [Streptomyces thermoalcalitolerans]|uniref:Chaplin domain-containing protein n=1 Tax=Streptomyces thermoalcalitolerans TaxID=65605 RepID=A0ABN1P3I2_9ACTN